MAALGEKVLGKDPGAKDVADKLRLLHDEESNINELWNRKAQDLQDARELQVRSNRCNEIFYEKKKYALT